MADWSQLPKELLHLISENLDSALYRLRFRSVCSSWRSSSSPISDNHILPFKFPILSNDSNNNPSTFSLSKRTLFLITPPHQHHQQTLQPWLIKIGPDPGGRTELWHPLTRIPIKPFASHFPQALDLYELPVFDLGHEFVLNVLGPRSLNSLYMEKVVFSCLGSGFVLLTIHVSGRLALFRSGDVDWIIIPDMPTPYDDVCVFKGRLCAVDNSGRTVVVGLDSSVGLVAEPVFGGDKKFLVESEGELLLVDKYIVDSDYLCVLEDDGDYVDDIHEVGWERAVRFDVYRLEEEEKKWVELRSLGDRVLFLGDDCAFSISVSDLSVGKGSCLIFRDDDYFNINDMESGLSVFHLDEGRISPLSDYPGFSKLFWPPPDWIRLQH